ncbi:MAG TPA: glycoside hydrolase family 2 TIM barrel-domain containing protein [Solirubrobacteraceae bacterium]|nr:glycoside hydrolase family 2 TIM barrel-domain containing protein [Solirubrobacteraceae bacterium]
MVPVARHRQARTLLALAAAILAVAGLVSLLTQSSTSHAATPAHANNGSAPPPPSAVNLDGTWQYRADPRQDGVSLGWPTGDGARGWQAATVPGVYNPNPLPQYFGGSVGWYRRSFTTPSTPTGFGWTLNFGEVRRVAEVWLNGVELGTHSDPYIAFTLPARSLAPPGQSNSLVVRVNNIKGVEPREGWWNWGGITRTVQLIPQGPVVLKNPGLIPQLHCTGPDRCTAAVLFDGWISNQTSLPENPLISVRMKAPHGGAVTVALHSAGTIAPGQTTRLDFTFPVHGTPDLWGPGHPALYASTITTTVGNTIAQSDQMNIGLRTVSVKNGVLLLNDRPIELKGASIEEDFPGVGPALTNADMNTLVSELQQLHADVTRAQYPLNPLLLDKLDAAGIMVWSQAPIYHRDELLQTPAQRAVALSTLTGTILSDRDHPSVITHSVANELTPLPDSTPGTRDYLDAAVNVVHGLDTSVPVSLDLLSYPGYPFQRTYLQFPLLGINNYFGWYAGRRGIHSTASINGLAPFLRTMHARYPAQALVMTEYGSEATIPGPVSVLHSFAFQQRYIEQTMGIVDHLSFMNGSIYWTLREFAVKPHWVGGPGGPGVIGNSIHHKGLITYDGVKKPAFGTLAALYAAMPVYRSGPAGSPSSPGMPVLVGLALSILLLGLLALIGVQVWAFAGIQAAGARRSWPGRVVRWRQQDPAGERLSA